MESQVISTLKKLITLLESDSDKFYSIANYLPYKIVIADTKTLDWEWCNNFATDLYRNSYYQYPYEENMSSLVRKVYCHSLDIIIKCISDSSRVCSFYSLLCVNNRLEWAQNIVMLIDEERYIQSTFLAKEMLGIGNVVVETLDSIFVNQETWDKFETLTTRELEILSALCEFDDLNEISAELGISINTTRKHKENINRKLGTKNHISLIRVAEAFSLLGKL